MNEEEVVLLTQYELEYLANDAPIPCWTQNLVYFLQTSLCPPEMSRKKIRYFRLQTISYALIDGVLCKRYINDILLRYIGIVQIEKALHEFHYGEVGGHFSPWVTMLKIMRVGYYWPIVFMDYYLGLINVRSVHSS